MSKKMKIPSIFKSKEAKQPWQWPSCKHPKTLSFRDDNFVFRTVNSVFLDPIDGLEIPESIELANDKNLRKLEEDGDQSSPEELLDDVIIHGVRSTDRLFFEPDDTGSLLKEEGNKISGVVLPFKQSVALALESDDPYMDFKRSMQEMVEAHGLKDWDCLEELLGWYLKANEKTNHGTIVGAFVDVLIGSLASSSSSNNNSSTTTTATCCSDISSSYSSADSCFSSPSSPASPSDNGPRL